MSRDKVNVAAVRAALDAVVADDPDRTDRRAIGGDMACRYTEQGRPACLVGHILHRLGFSIGRLKALDRAADGKPVDLSRSEVGKRFTGNAFALLCHLQNSNDRGRTWSRARWEALTPEPGGSPSRVRSVPGRKQWLVAAPGTPGRDRTDPIDEPRPGRPLE